MSTETQNSKLKTQNLHELLLALADDEFVIGYANSEWTGIAPVLEEDIAFSSLAQDELGHAKLFYELIAELQIANCKLQTNDQANPQSFDCAVPERACPAPRRARELRSRRVEGQDSSAICNLQSPDEIAYGRAPEAFRNAQLVERPRGDWAYSVSRQFLYDTADYVRLESLQRSAYAPLATAAGSIIREEKYHLLHAQTWLERLAGGSAEARARQRAAFMALWTDALGLFEPLPGESELLAASIMPESSAALQARWLESISAPFGRLELPWPFDERVGGWEPQFAPSYGGRRGVHGASFLALYDMITSVYRFDPSAKW